MKPRVLPEKHRSVSKIVSHSIICILLASCSLVTLFTSETLADGAFRWTDSSGKQHFGSNPPANATNVQPLRGKSFSRYSSERLLRPYSRMALSTEALEKKLEEADPEGKGKNSKQTAEGKLVEKLPPLPELPPLEEENLVPVLQQGEVKVSHDNEMRITSCEVLVKNTSSLPVSDLIVAFEFSDGTLIPGIGPSTINGTSEASFQVPQELLPITLKGVPSGAEPPLPKVSIQAGTD